MQLSEPAVSADVGLAEITESCYSSTGTFRIKGHTGSRQGRIQPLGLGGAKKRIFAPKNIFAPFARPPGSASVRSQRLRVFFYIGLRVESS